MLVPYYILHCWQIKFRYLSLISGLTVTIILYFDKSTYFTWVSTLLHWPHKILELGKEKNHTHFDVLIDFFPFFKLSILLGHVHHMASRRVPSH